jgi:hypothetical protein
MSIRTLIRVVSLAIGLVLASPLAWSAAGPLPLLVGLGLLGLTLAYLALLAGGGNLTRWHLRYQLEAGDEPGRLEEILRFLAEKTGHFVVEASARGLFLELPAAFDRYVEAQLPQALPEVRLSKDDHDHESRAGGSFFFSVGAPNSDLLRWATEAEGRQMRLHIHQGPYATLTVWTDGVRPPGRWMRLRMPQGLWQHLPVWDELSAGVRLSSLFPPTGDGAVYSSRSRLLQLTPPDGYTPDATGRTLGLSTAGRLLTLGYDVPLFTVGAPSSFLVRQALDDLEAGRTAVVVSPYRRILEQIERGAGDVPIYWLEPQNSRRSAHLAIATGTEAVLRSTDEWGAINIETTVQVVQTFLAELGIGVDLPAVGAFTRRLVHALANSARQAGLDLSFTDLYVVSQGTQALRAFLVEVQDLAGDSAEELLAHLDDDAGYVQAVTILSAIRTALKPLGTGPLHALCRPPFLNISQALGENCLLLVPMTNADFPEHDRLLSAMLDLTLSRVLAVGGGLNLQGVAPLAVALHLHDPHLYRVDHGQRWLDVSRQDPRLSLLLDVQDPGLYSQVQEEGEEGEVIFRCSEALASALIGDWNLPASIADLTELPTGTAITRLPGMVVTLKGKEE